MRHRLIPVFCAALLLASCALHEGIYAPDCIAFAGDRIQLADGRFAWDKFTDQRIVNEAGEIVDPHPGFPVQGRYELIDERVALHADSGESLPDWYLVERFGHFYLLTPQQHLLYSESGDFANCPLALGRHQ